MSMKKSPIKRTPQKNLKNSTLKQSASSQNTNASQISSNLYFCHFKNAMYMGGIKAFQKNGRGILLHDNGTNVISSYYNDLLHGHNIFFKNSCLLSGEYFKNRLSEAVYRTDGFLLAVYYNSDGQLDGKATLINYLTKNIIHCNFKKGQMTDKEEETDFTVINRVFQLGQIDFLIGKKHAKTLSYNFQRQNNLAYQRIGSRLVIGFEKHGLTNGLAFSYMIKTSSGFSNFQNTRNQDFFELNLIERGYYINSQLNGFGQKIFKNGNSYIGQFKCDVFEGNGILKNNLKRNWVSGFFEKGNLVDLLEYNHQGGQKKYDKIIEGYHEKRSNWINNDIQLIDWHFFDQQIHKIINTQPNTQVKTLQQRKQQVLRKIQENFICENNNVPGPTTLRQIQQFTGVKTNIAITSEKQSARKFVRNFIPEGQNYTPHKFYLPNKMQIKQSERKEPLTSSRRRNQIIAQSRKSKVSLRKSKIFESKGVTPSKSVDSFLKLQKVPVRENEQRSPRNNKSKSFFNATNSRLNQSEVRQQQQQSRISMKVSPKANSSSVNFTRNTSPEKALDSKRLIGKSRIFSYLNGDQDDITPKFHYNENRRPQTANVQIQEESY